MINSLIYVALSVWGVYTTYLLFEIFYDTKPIHIKKKLVIFGIYFLIINFVYLKINIPLVILMTNIIYFVIISVIYGASRRKTIISVALIYLIRMSAESISAILMSYEKLYILKCGVTTPIEALFLGNLVAFCVVILLKHYKNLKKEASLSSKQWGLLVFIAAISLYMIIFLLSLKEVSVIWKLIGLIGMVSINLSIVYLYSSIIGFLQDKFDKEMYKKETEFQKMQMKVMFDSSKATKTLKHNLKNNLIVLSDMIENEKTKEAIDLIKDIVEFHKLDVKIANTGNVTIDSILNYNIARMQELGVKYNLNLSVPYDIDIDSIYLVTILSNAIDNALDALEKIDEKERYIIIDIKYKKGILFIMIENPYKSQINIENNRIKTSKKNKENHGIGLKSIEEMVEKRNGTMTIESTNEIFKIKITI